MAKKTVETLEVVEPEPTLMELTLEAETALDSLQKAVNAFVANGTQTASTAVHIVNTNTNADVLEEMSAKLKDITIQCNKAVKLLN